MTPAFSPRCCAFGAVAAGRFIPARRDHKAQLALMAPPARLVLIQPCPAHKVLQALIQLCQAPKAPLAPMAHLAHPASTALLAHKAPLALPLSLLMLATPAPSALMG